jgi:hypothetical protein
MGDDSSDENLILSPGYSYSHVSSESTVIHVSSVSTVIKTESPYRLNESEYTRRIIGNEVDASQPPSTWPMSQSYTSSRSSKVSSEESESLAARSGDRRGRCFCLLCFSCCSSSALASPKSLSSSSKE